MLGAESDGLVKLVEAFLAEKEAGREGILSALRVVPIA